MYIIPPITVTDAVLTSSNVPETDYSAYSASTVYAAGDYVRVVAADVHKVYKALAGSRATVTMTIASPCVVSWNNHGLADGTPIQFSTTGVLPGGVNAPGAVYYVKSPTTNSFNVAATAGGAAINTTGSQSGTHTATAGNMGNTPASSPTYWLDAGSTNRWKMFDQGVQSQTSNPTSIDVQLTVSGRADAVALINVNASSARITMTSPTDGLVYDQTYSLVADSGIDNWYRYFFSTIARKSELVVNDLPPYADSVIGVTISEPGGTAYAGGVVVGQQIEIGDTEYGASVGIQDYSIKSADAFGNYTITQRAYASRGRFNIVVENTMIDYLKNLLASYRATPVVYVGSSLYGCTISYGFYKEFNIVISNYSTSDCSIDTEGLT